MANPADISGRGPLFPAELPTDFARFPAGDDAKDLVVWWWTSRWSLPPGRTSAQELLAFPASNLVFEDDAVRYWGPTTKRSTRILAGRDWALGALLRPAAVPAFTEEPAASRDGAIAGDSCRGPGVIG